MKHTILWNGCKDHPGGAQLFAPEYPRVSDQPTPDRHSYADARVLQVSHRNGVHNGTYDRVRLAMKACEGWFTPAEIIALTGLEKRQVTSALAGLSRSGDLEKSNFKLCVHYRVKK